MDVNWKIGGEAGFGIMTTGTMFARLCTRHGYSIFDYAEYPSLIRGGHNVYEVHVSDSEAYAPIRPVDVLVALNRETIDLHAQEVRPGGILIYDNEAVSFTPPAESNFTYYGVPFTRLVREGGLLKVMENNAALGISAAVFGMDRQILNDLIRDVFADKGSEIIAANQKAAVLGYDWVIKNPPLQYPAKLSLRQAGKQIVVTANEACVLGAIAGGCRFYAAYPMTPTSAALHYMAEIGPQFGVVVKHAEDEISVINMAIGAGFAGARAMVGTSGGGFSLMVEGLGLAGITETPLVILMGQRPGPATGMPTWTGQADLKFIINSSQDEFPRFVLTPGDPEEAFRMTAEAFNLAEIYQTPVFILVDKFISEGHKSIHLPLPETLIERGKLIDWNSPIQSEDYKRYRVTDDGLPERALPGMPYIFTANSYEHDETGLSTETAKMRGLQVERRQRKINKYIQNFPTQSVYGSQEPELLVVGWGSTKCPVLEAIKNLSDEIRPQVGFLHLTHIWPFPHQQVNLLCRAAKKVLLVEGNSEAQLGGLIREQTGFEIKNRYLKYDGRPFYAEDIAEKIKEALV